METIDIDDAVEYVGRSEIYADVECNVKKEFQFTFFPKRAEAVNVFEPFHELIDLFRTMFCNLFREISSKKGWHIFVIQLSEKIINWISDRFGLGFRLEPEPLA